MSGTAYTRGSSVWSSQRAAPHSSSVLFPPSSTARHDDRGGRVRRFRSLRRRWVGWCRRLRQRTPLPGFFVRLFSHNGLFGEDDRRPPVQRPQSDAGRAAGRTAEQNGRRFSGDKKDERIHRASQVRLGTHHGEQPVIEQLIDLELGLSRISHVERLCDLIVERTARLFNARRCSLMTADQGDHELVVKAQVGMDPAIMPHARRRWGEPIAGWVALHRRSILVEDVRVHPAVSRPIAEGYTTPSFMAVPLIHHDAVLGVLSVADKITGDCFSRQDLRLLELIGRLSVVPLDNARLYRTLRYTAMTDPLTHVFNHRYLAKAIDAEIHRTERFGGTFSLIVLDIVDFKAYNQQHGRLNGDRILGQMARRLQGLVRCVDISGRYAGDEFMVILPNTIVENAVTVALRLQEALSRPEPGVTFRIHAGVVGYRKGLKRHDLLLRVDAALRRAKTESNGGFVALGA